LKKEIKWLLAAGAAVAVLIVVLKLTGGSASEALTQTRPEAVRVGEVVRGPITEEARITGEVEATAEVELAPKVSGRLVDLAVDEGDSVPAGGVVAVIDNETFRAAVRHAEAAVAVAEAGLQLARANFENARIEFERTRRLFEQGTVPESSRDNAEAAYKAASANVAVAEAEVERARAALQLARIDLDESTLEAPFDAVVAARLLDVGALVSPGNPIVRLVSVDTVKVTAGVAERYLADLVPGETAADVTVDALGGRRFSGVLYRISPVLDAATRTAEADIRIPNPHHELKPGMYARVSLVTKTRGEAVLVPNDAVLGREGSHYVFVVDGERAVRVGLEPGLRGARFTEALSGPKPGDLVVTSGAGNLFDGARIEVQESAP